ncbi:MAG TPA: glycosyl hydrolase [Candidatus Saccharimonadales bacterium]|nr:glycosyl hydrolase [Candidatus Saccharimonadales bacterium]
MTASLIFGQNGYATGRPVGKLSPASGSYWGTYTSYGIANRESLIGRKFVIHQKYYDFTNTFPGSSEQDDIVNGRIPLDTWQPQLAGGAQLTANEDAAIAAGTYDSTIITRAQAIKTFGHPIFIRFGHEMNGNWYPWSANNNNNDPSQYVAAWRHVHDIFVQQGATNAVWVWCPNIEDAPNQAWNHWTNYYPGDSYVDWVGIDGYNWGDTQSFSSWKSFANAFGNGTSGVYNDYATVKPIMIAETASAESGAPVGTSKGQWITDMAASIQSTFPNVEAFVWFDTTSVTNDKQWPIDTSAGSQSAYVSAGQLSFFNPTVNYGKTGDLNLDGQINIDDLSRLLSDWGATNNSVSDLNHNNNVTITDLSILLTNWGT